MKAMDYAEWEKDVPQEIKADSLCAEIIKLLLTMIPQQRGYAVHENAAAYGDPSKNKQPDADSEMRLLSENLTHIPMPD